MSFGQVFPPKLTKLHFFHSKDVLELYKNIIEKFLKIDQNVLRNKKFENYSTIKI
jgi:hypothetical protein